MAWNVLLSLPNVTGRRRWLTRRRCLPTKNYRTALDAKVPFLLQGSAHPELQTEDPRPHQAPAGDLLVLPVRRNAWAWMSNQEVGRRTCWSGQAIDSYGILLENQPQRIPFYSIVFELK
jgi:hypothetical protein